MSQTSDFLVALRTKRLREPGRPVPHWFSYGLVESEHDGRQAEKGQCRMGPAQPYCGA